MSNVCEAGTLLARICDESRPLARICDESRPLAILNEGFGVFLQPRQANSGMLLYVTLC